MSKTLPDIGLRDFLRGGYKELAEPTVIRWHGKPVGVWSPIQYGATGIQGVVLTRRWRDIRREIRDPAAIQHGTEVREAIRGAGSNSLPAWLRQRGGQ